MNTWHGVLMEPAKLILAEISHFLMGLLLVVLILLIGWLVSLLIKSLVVKVLRTLKVDELSDRIELDNILAKGGIQYSLSELIGVLFYWIGILISFVVAINAAGLTIAADLLNRIVLFVPNVVAAIFILVAGMFVASLLKNIVKAGASNAGLGQSNLLSKIVEILIMVFAVAMALQQLNIATLGVRIIENAINIVFAAFGLAFALAVGLGCKDLAGRLVGEFVEKLRKK